MASALTLEGGGDFGVPLGSECGRSPCRRRLRRSCGWTRRGRVRRPRRRSGGREEVVELGLGEIEFDLVEGFERVAEVDEDQVALVAELGIESRANGRVGSWRAQGC